MGTGRRARKKQATRAALRAAALELSLDHGAENVTVEQIAAAADMTSRTFFNHFGSKEEAIIDAVQNEVFLADELRRPHPWTECLRARPPAEPIMAAIRAAQRDAYEAALPYLTQSAKVWKMLIESPTLMAKQTNALGNSEEQSFAAAIADRLDAQQNTDFDPGFLASCAFVALRTAMIRWITGPDGDDPEELRACADGLLAQIEAGFQRPE